MTLPIRKTGILLAGIGTAAVVVLGAPTPASASCAEPPPLEDALAQAPVAFVGTAVEVRDGTSARFRVEEVWAGPDLEEVVIRGGEGGGVQTSVDRSWQEGERYLVLPYADGTELRDNSCTRTQVWTEELAAFRPAEARTVTPSESPPDDDVGQDRTVLALGALAFLVLAAGGALAARTRRGEEGHGRTLG